MQLPTNGKPIRFTFLSSPEWQSWYSFPLPGPASDRILQLVYLGPLPPGSHAAGHFENRLVHAGHHGNVCRWVPVSSWEHIRWSGEQGRLNKLATGPPTCQPPGDVHFRHGNPTLWKTWATICTKTHWKMPTKLFASTVTSTDLYTFYQHCRGGAQGWRLSSSSSTTWRQSSPLKQVVWILLGDL